MDEAKVIYFLGVQTDGRTDRHAYRIRESSHGNMSAKKKFNSKLGVCSQSLYVSPDDGDA